jgi:glycosyltransferase involved in cell wall biosynthesis
VITSTAPGQTCESGTQLYSVHRIPSANAGNYSIGFFKQASRTVAGLNCDLGFDIVHTHDFAGLFFHPPAGVCWIQTVHGTLFSETPLDWRYRAHRNTWQNAAAAVRGVARFALMPAFAGMLRHCNRLVVDSDFTRRELLAAYPYTRGKITDVPLGIDFRRYPGSFDGEKRLGSEWQLKILLLGRLSETKGISIALQAAATLKSMGVPFEMTIAGRGKFEDGAHAMATTLDVIKQVSFPGYVAPEAIPRLFAASNIFLFPDLTQPAFGLVALEAMAYGLPVMGARSGAIPEVVPEECGWLFDPWDSIQLAGMLARIYQAGASILKQKSDCAMAYAKLHSGEQMAQNMENVYLNCLADMSDKTVNVAH